ncbi:hypothetical protein [Lachnospira multipara]|uniref:Uncharacterized protein n=1 Tax=Lachnospira multipara TaxID=28051 RepID=A0A1H5X126_9FIRM|nr:hypothetical protein [Lachnospira multipara]SEG04987.1 hypothetical protein SAMN05216537_12015 [Lachnospira multipara]
MKEFIEKSIGMEVDIKDIDYNGRLPMIYSSLYDFKIASMHNIEWLIAIPKEKINLAQLRKNHRQIEKLLDMRCALYIKNTSTYSKNAMIADGIPFIVEDKEIYLPFLGILLNSARERTIKPVQRISFLTQKMILTAIYEKWNGITVTKAAEQLDITKMSASRCFDEIDFFDIPILGTKGKSRVINVSDDIKELWNSIEVYMRNPVINIFYINDNLNLPVFGGMSALAEYSMISDNKYPTYVVAKKDIKDLALKDRLVDIKKDEPGCIIQEVGYVVSFGKGDAIDPLSLLLSLSDNEKADERIEISIREMLEEYVW